MKDVDPRELLADLATRATEAARALASSAFVRSIVPLSGGYSSLTYQAVLASSGEPDRRIVLKVAPPGLEPVRNRDVLRQARVLAALRDVVGVRVPDVLFESIGAPPQRPPFFAMSFADGDSVDPLVDRADEPAGVVLAARALAAARMLGAMHHCSPTSIGLGGEPAMGLRAEVERWCRALESVDDDLRLDGPALGDRLLEVLPAEDVPVLVHGDYKLGNMRCQGAEICALVDWEIWSIGDGRTDLAWFLMMLDPRYPARVRDVPELPTPGEIQGAYEAVLGRSVHDMGWFHAFVRFKQAATTALITKQARKRGEPGYPELIAAHLGAVRSGLDQ